ncbi:MAG: hypothetical protein ABTS16_01925 [Candidatus Accumulibacter phosphatis]|jgi:hypothetical protein|uniref:Uncharacterized protein n=1 Tax=Candidatus Accumulibacter contiguus TaxID=2954381 RepID=A0ABX1T7B8_9PROT|nr:hypothetical protein [Candidatus Accumulibacter contiguus]NMQ05555.1 hypothetical protein [Candidatus Accumulibacter contiguus]
MQVFRSIQDDALVRSIAGATRRLVFVAPGVSAAVGKVLENRLAQAPGLQIMIVLDADEETCRLGYCDAPSLETLSRSAAGRGIPIRQQRGIRIGLLMADDEILVWTPTPLMFEAPRDTDEPNGLLLTQETLQRLPEALGVDPEHPAADGEIGAEPLHPEDVAAVVEAIKAVPPAPFDLSRLSRVFSSKFQFIETVLRGAELTKREMRLDSLIVNSDAPEELQPLLHTTVQPFNTDADKAIEVPVLVNGEQAFNKAGQPLKVPTTQTEVRSYWTKLTDRYIVNLPGFGKIIRHSDKVKFEEGKAAFEIVLKDWVKGFQDLVKGDHDQRVQRVVTLIEQRMQRANERQKLTRDKIEELVRKGLDNLRVIEPTVKVVYKNITVESTRDKEFLEVLRKAVPEQELEGWFQIFSAAPMVQTSPGSCR